MKLSYNEKIATALNAGQCKNHTGKMEGMVSWSTSALENPICQKRVENGESVCSHCYACRMAKCYKALNEKLKRNTELITTVRITPDEAPRFYSDVVRLEAFGDLQNTIQVENYFAFCEGNPHAVFALWTKNPWYISEALASGYSKPDNLIVVLSMPLLDVPIPEEDVKKCWPFVDHTFVVYHKDYAAAEGVFIQCGKSKCYQCRKCYRKDTEFQINEVLK